MTNENRLIYANEAYEIARASGRHSDFARSRADLTSLEEVLEECTTVDAVEVVHGRWIDDGGLDEDGNGQYRCSRCGVGEKHNPTVPVSYCWNCGAKMDGDGDG